MTCTPDNYVESECDDDHEAISDDDLQVTDDDDDEGNDDHEATPDGDPISLHEDDLEDDLECTFDLESSLTEDLNANSPLYSGSNLTVLEAVAQHFEWFTDYPGTSKEALSSMLHMQHNILPKGNLLPDSYTSARRLIEPFLVQKEVYHACPNDCILFRNLYAINTTCPKCNASQYKHGNLPARSSFIFH